MIMLQYSGDRFAHIINRIDPILIATVCIMDDFGRERRARPELFLAKLTNGEPPNYYAQHIKNLAIVGGFDINAKPIEHILAVCTGVENLVLLTQAFDIGFFKHPLAGRNLRRLAINLERFESKSNFNHPCFTNITHLHLWDHDWPTYPGWENLASLTHLAFACSGTPSQVRQLMRKVPTVRYVALGSYHGENRYGDAVINNGRHRRKAWSVRVVFLGNIPDYDWERGARGKGDFWDVVEREVQRRLGESSVDLVD